METAIAFRRFRDRLLPLLAWNGPLITFLALVLATAAGLLLIRLTPLDGVLFVVLAVGGVATLIEPLAGVVAALFLGPLRAYLSTEMPQMPAQIAQVFVALTLVSWLVRGLVRRDIRFPCLVGEGEGNHGGLHEGNHKGNHEGNHKGLPLLVFLGAALLSLWDAVELPVYGVTEFIKWVQILLLLLIVSDYLTPRRLPWLLGALLVSGLFQAGVGIWQFGLRGEGPDHFAILVLGERFYRAYGTFEQPNPYAGYIGMTLALATGMMMEMLRDKGTRRKEDKETRRQGDKNLHPLSPPPRPLAPPSSGLLVILPVTIALGAALLASWSRGAWLGFGAAVAVMAVALPREARWGLLLAAVLIAGGLGLYATGLVPAPVVARLTDFVQDVRFEDVRGVGINNANYAVIERLAHWQAALEMIRYNLWTGVGFGCYEPAYRDFALINWPIALGHAHNYYLNLAAETGLIGLAAYLLLWGTIFWQTWQVTRRAAGPWRGIAIGLLGTWTHLSVHHLLDNLYVNNVHLHIGALLGILAFVIRRTRVAGQPTARPDRLPAQTCQVLIGEYDR